MAEGDIRTFGGQKYKQVGWSKDRDGAEEFVYRARHSDPDEVYKIVQEESSDGKIRNGWALYRKISK